MSDNLITPEEIKTLRAGAKPITLERMMGAMAEGKIIPVIPITLNSGYMISMTIDKLDGRTAEHISISKQEGRTDPADAEVIARAVIGEGWIMKGSAFNRNVIHFIKIMEE
ncbi:MAG: hypothetical protein V1854_04825 [Methanobacteriota archaeon]